ncbi:MAG: metalloregulator ArsR/SmtB family transcription factor [Alphaproteobacteria bacterium]
MESRKAIEAFSALAQPTRLAIVKLLVRAGDEGVAAGDIARHVDAPASTISTHLAILSRAGLIDARRESRSIIYAVDMDRVSALLAFIVEDCCQGRPEICTPLASVVRRAAACCPKPASKNAFQAARGGMTIRLERRLLAEALGSLILAGNGRRIRRHGCAPVCRERRCPRSSATPPQRAPSCLF